MTQLNVVSNLAAADPARIVEIRRAAGVAEQRCVREGPLRLAPGAAEVPTDVKAGPVVRFPLGRREQRSAERGAYAAQRPSAMVASVSREDGGRRDVDVRLEIASGVVSASASASSRHGGWTIGTGVEYFLTKNVVVGVDYSFINLDDKTYQLTCVAACGVNPVVNVDPESIHMVTGRISFKFGGPEPAPLK